MQARIECCISFEAKLKNFNSLQAKPSPDKIHVLAAGYDQLTLRPIIQALEPYKEQIILVHACVPGTMARKTLDADIERGFVHLRDLDLDFDFSYQVC